jgi:hypothetical protein
MISGLGRHRLRGGSFSVRPSMRGGDNAPRGVGAEIASKEQASIPANTTLNSFVKPSGMPLNVGIVSDSPYSQIYTAREMFDNDPIAGAVAETLGNIPFGKFSLGNMKDKELLNPYLRSCDHMRVITLMPLLATTFLVDGAFLGSGLYSSASKDWSAMVLQDLLHAQILPVPFFGATPLIDVTMSPEMARTLTSSDPRMERYRRFVTDELEGGTMRLEPDNTFYIPRRTMAHHTLGQSLFRRIMIVYALEKALTRGTIELAYRRQRPLLHVQVGDESWDATIDEMNQVANLFQNADLDPIGATVVTRPGVNSQEIGGAGDFWKWTDNIDVLTSVKLKGMGMPDGLLGGDMALDSVSATLTVFINMNRQFREYITRAFMYEKMFPYISVTNDHRKTRLGTFEETGHSRDSNLQYYRTLGTQEVDLSDYAMPTVSWHNSLRPEGDREYLEMLNTLSQSGVPIPLRVMATAGGQDINDVINGQEDDLEVRAAVAGYQARIAQFAQVAQGGGQDDGGGYDDQQEQGGIDRSLHRPLRRKGLANRQFDPRDLPRTNINGHSYVTTAREQKRRMEAENKVVAEAMTKVAARENHLHKTDVVGYQPTGRSPI